MARYVSLGKDANFFRDSVLDISIAPGEIVELNAMQLNSRSIRRALQGGHLIFVEKTKTEKAPELTVDDLMQYIPAPDFPTGGIIYGQSDIRRAYQTGNGKAIIRAKTTIEGDENGKQKIVVTELPYGVGPAEI